MLPDRLGKYELRGTLGKGAMGVVYDAWDPIIERRVAVKTIRLPADGDEDQAEGYERFKREAQAAGRLNHPGIVAVYDYGDTDGVAYIAMELIEGRSLKDLLDAEHRLSPEAAVRLMRELLAALGYSHSRGIIHRDIKPTNILLTDAGALKITDFGIARIESSSMTQMGTVMGTPAYMSPEQFMGQTVDQRTDIYAAGVLLFQLLTGERPFDGGLTAIMHKVLHTTPPKPSELSVTAPEAFDAVVARAMARRPEDRYPSAEAFSAAITTALAGGAAAAPDGGDATLVVPARPTSTPTPPRPGQTAAPVPRQAAKPAKRTPVALIGGIAATAAAVVGVAAFLLLRSPAEKPAPPVQIASNSGVRVPPPVWPSPAPTPASSPLASTEPSPAYYTTPRAPPPMSAPLATPPPAYQPPAAPSAQAASSAANALPSRPADEALPEPLPPAIIPPPMTPAFQEPPSYPQVASALPPPVQPEPAPYVPPSPQVITPPVARASQSAPAPLTAAAFRDVACTLLDARTGPDNRLVVNGLAGAGAPETAALALVAAPGARAVAVDWRATRVDGPYCGVIDTLRAIRNAQGAMPSFELSLRGNRPKLRNGEVMAPVITAVPFPGHLQLVYFQSDGTVVPLFPAPGAQDRVQPGAAPRMGDPKTGGWPVSEPFGTDMMVAVVSSETLPAGPADASPASYLAALRRAADQLIRKGSPVLVRALPVQTTP